MTSLLPRTLRRWLALGSCALAASCDAVTVQAPLVVSVEVVPGTVNLAVGESRQLQAVVRDEDGTPLSASQIDWSSSSPAVAGVSPTGTVSGLTAGSATVRARVGGVTGTADVVVSAAAGFRVDSTDVTFTAQAGGSTSAPKAVVISAAGAVQANALQVAVTYDAGQPTGWLSAGLSSTTTPALLTLAADADGIPVGDFGANVEISAPGYEPTTVRARLSVRGTAASIRLSRTSVAFQANSGGAVPLPQSVDVTNAGSGTLSGLTASIDYGGGPGGWLTATLQSNTAPTQLTLSARQGTLPVGTYTATVGVASTAAANSPQAVTVTFTVAQAGGAPRIGLAADTVDFAWSVGTSLPAPRSVAIRNLGGGTLSGLASSVSYAPGQPTGWLLAQLDGTTAPTALELALDPGSLGAGTYEASVEIVSSVAANSPVFLRVVFTITSGPLIALSQDSIGFSAIQGAGNPTSQSVQVSNAGTGALTGLGTQVAYTPGQPSGWLNASLSGTSAPATVTLAATTGALGAGTYTATVNVTAAGANNSPEPITVTFTVLTPAPSIGLSPTSVPFNGVVGQPSPSAATVSVTNAGGQPLTGLAVGTIAYAGGASGWLSATLSGSNAPATLTLTPSITGLAAGTYTATVPVTSPVALTRTVAVTFTVADPPAFGLNPTSLTFNATQGGGNPATQTVSVSNTGGGTLNGLSTSIQYAGATTGWLSASLSGTSAPTTLTVSAATGSLAPGTYNASVTLNSTASGGVVSTPIAVAFVVAPPPPAIGLAPTSLSFSAVQNTSAPAAQTVTVTNTGGQTLSGLTATVSAGAASWLSATLNGTTAPTSITVQPSTASLSPGTYSGTVTVTAPGAANSPQTVSVTYTVAAPPSIVLSASARSFTAVQGGANPSSQSVNVTNGGGGTLDGLSASVSYGSGQPTGWLNASVGASAPTTLTLQPSVGSLGPG
ncbi:MAG: choice-of-anchor D domain-containing protein, partial [Gemmatimonadetes bacterium]|nr:choice-of-anchor D domain-containing protein [Gemmatimonadota bacterium]